MIILCFLWVIGELMVHDQQSQRSRRQISQSRHRRVRCQPSRFIEREIDEHRVATGLPMKYTWVAVRRWPPRDFDGRLCQQRVVALQNANVHNGALGVSRDLK